MYKCKWPNNVEYTVMSDWVLSVVYMFNEYYKFDNTWINVNALMNYSHDKKLGIFYDMEHKFPVPAPIEPPSYTEMFINMVKEYDYILSFQIENYEYYKAARLEDKFRFVPLRYTSYFEQFVEDKSYRDKPFDVQFECSIDTQLRHDILGMLSQDIVFGQGDSRLNILMTNTDNALIKYKLKNLAKYGIDFPHYDVDITMNNFRIWEYVCMNMPVILIDDSNIGTSKYFDKFIVKKFNTKFDVKDIKNICNTYHEYTEAERFKQMTQSNINYDNYRISIIKDFSDKYRIKIPDTVLLNDFCD